MRQVLVKSDPERRVQTATEKYDKELVRRMKELQEYKGEE